MVLTDVGDGSESVRLSAGLDFGSNLIHRGHVPEQAGVSPYQQTDRKGFSMDIELKRDAKSVIDRIVHLRDSL
jgi:hypothetical protein